MNLQFTERPLALCKLPYFMGLPYTQFALIVLHKHYYKFGNTVNGKIFVRV